MTSRHQPVPAISLGLQPVKVKLAMIIRYGIVIRSGYSRACLLCNEERRRGSSREPAPPTQIGNEERRRGSRDYRLDNHGSNNMYYDNSHIIKLLSKARIQSIG